MTELTRIRGWDLGVTESYEILFFFLAAAVGGFFFAGILSMLRFRASMMSTTLPPRCGGGEQIQVLICPGELKTAYVTGGGSTTKSSPGRSTTFT
jgi:hypothetical protein